MMKGIISVICVVFFSFASFSQARNLTSTITGKISDAQTGLPLAGATIIFSDVRMGTNSDSNGIYSLKNVPLGHHVLEVSYSTYKTEIVHLDVVGNLEQNIALTSAIIINEGVTVTGVTTATSIRNIPVPVTLIRKTELMQTPSTNIIDALTRQPGITQVSTGPAISKPVIRGLGYNRVVVINDGARQEGQQWGDEHGIEIDELSVSRAEIVKGPASLIYGSDALAGVIQFITNSPVPEGTLRGNIYSNVQSNNGLLALNANLAGNQNGFNWNAYGSAKSAKDYRNKWDGRVLNSRFNEKNFGGYVGLNKSWGFSHLIFSSFNQNVGLVEGDRDDATGIFLVNPGSPTERISTNEDRNTRDLFIPRQNVQHFKLMSDNNVRVGSSRVKINLGFQENRRKEFGDTEVPNKAGLFFDLRTVNYNLQWRLPEGKGFETTIGASGMNQQNENRGIEYIIPEYSLNDIGGFVFVQKSLKLATISGGIRYDDRKINSQALSENGEVKFEAFQRSFSNVSGSAGISYHPFKKVNFKANIARGFRAPTLSELASNGAHEGTNRYEYGQRNLKSERSYQVDAGVNLSYEHFTFSLTGFRNRMKDFIFYSRLQNALGEDSLVTVDGEELEAFQYNQNNAKLAGIEISMDVHPHPLDWLHVQNSLALLRGRFDEAVDGSKHLPLIPPAKWISQLRTDIENKNKAFRNWYILVEMERNFDQDKPFTGYGTETETKGYTLFHAGFGFDIASKSRTIANLHFSGNNLTDQAYQSHLSRLKYADVNEVTGRQGVFNMGRNFSVKLNVPLSFRTDKVKF